MVDQVVIIDIKRGKEYISEFDIHQMAGRAGRSYSKMDAGKVTVLVPNCDESTAEDLLYNNIPVVKSQMNIVKNVASHILPLFKNEITALNVENWYKRSLSYFQGNKLDIDKLLKYLKEYEMIENNKLTDLGYIASKFYLEPEKAYLLKEKFQEIIRKDIILDPLAFSWALATKEDVYEQMYGFIIDEFEGELYGRKLELYNNEKYDCFANYCIFNNKRPKKVLANITENRINLKRNFAIINYMNKKFDWQIENDLNLMQICMRFGIDVTKAELMIDFNVYNKKIICNLMDEFIFSKKDVDSGKKEMSQELKQEIEKWQQEQKIC